MEKLTLKLSNCYGIEKMNCSFQFDGSIKNGNSYSIYAPNGLMKTSLAKTFRKISEGKEPVEERFGRTPVWNVTCDGKEIEKDCIYVLNSEVDIRDNSDSVTDILVKRESKERYDELVVRLEKLKAKTISDLQKLSGLKKADIQGKVVSDFGFNTYDECLRGAVEAHPILGWDNFKYSIIFDEKVLDIIEGEEFLKNAEEFLKRYDEIFEKEGSIYEKGTFNPAGARSSFSSLSDKGFFACGHKVHLKGDDSSIGEEELEERLQEINEELESDPELKSIRDSLQKNAKTNDLAKLIESLSEREVSDFLEGIRPDNIKSFKLGIWINYIQNSSSVKLYLEELNDKEKEIEKIEKEASEDIGAWTNAVSLFNARFVGLPFSLDIENHVDAALGKGKAKLLFKFQGDGEGEAISWDINEVKTLSKGERRALYLLTFIFDVEAIKLKGKEALFIIDDPADSFDYKNKVAIIEYLTDLAKVDRFYQLILTHNFDFYRSLVGQCVPYKNCLMANRGSNEIKIIKAEGINNIFTKLWKKNIDKNQFMLCATVPFTRNIVEYTVGTSDDAYGYLTSILHYKEQTEGIMVSDYLAIYNKVFHEEVETAEDQGMFELINKLANEVCEAEIEEGLNLEKKVLMSIAIRVLIEKFLIRKIRELESSPEYWCEEKSQFKVLCEKYEALEADPEVIAILNRVSVSVSSNIHLNAFMYEPILDLSLHHLINLYKSIQAIN